MRYALLALTATLLWACASEVGNPPGPVVTNPNPTTTVIVEQPSGQQGKPVATAACKADSTVNGEYLCDSELHDGEAVEVVKGEVTNIKAITDNPKFCGYMSDTAWEATAENTTLEPPRLFAKYGAVTVSCLRKEK